MIQIPNALVCWQRTGKKLLFAQSTKQTHFPKVPQDLSSTTRFLAAKAGIKEDFHEFDAKPRRASVPRTVPTRQPQRKERAGSANGWPAEVVGNRSGRCGRAVRNLQQW
jgi:hypothetical protein